MKPKLYAARKRYHCDRDCGDPIEPGTRYARHGIPPHSELGNESWWTLRSHGPEWDACPAHAAQLAEVDSRPVMGQQTEAPPTDIPEGR